MGIVAKYKPSDVNKAIDSFYESCIKKEIESLKYLGEYFSNTAKQIGSYTDRTGNLRSSIGYVVGLNGKMLSSEVKAVSKDKDNLGQRTGASSSSRLLSKYSSGLNLIGFAGMKYGLDVEAGANGRPKDVIAGAILMTKQIANKIFK